MDPDRYRELLLQHLPYAKPASGRTEVVCKCLYCPDDGDHYHMYVSIPQHGREPSKHNCFKCGTHGWVTHRKLIEWNIFDQEMSEMLINHYKSAYFNSYYTNEGSISSLNNTIITDSRTSKIKLDYINNRLGLNLSYQDMLDNKIVLNLFDLYQANFHMKYHIDDEYYVSLFSEYFLGFISYDNNFINFKRLIKEGNLPQFMDTRYYNYKVFNVEDNSRKFYLNPTNIDLYDPNPIKVHIAEGPFDALSIKYNLRKDFYNNIYMAITGNAYKGAIRQIISYIKLVNIEIHLYPDSDVSNRVIEDFMEYIRPYRYTVYLHRNLIGKDMGESIDKIDEYIERIY